MMRVTPLRLTTRQCSQIGCTLVRTFTKILRRYLAGESAKTLKIGTLRCPCKGRISVDSGRALRDFFEHPAHGESGVLGRRDSPSEDDVGGAGASRIERRHDAALVIRRIAR